MALAHAKFPWARCVPGLQAMEVSTTQGQALRYTLLNLPHYLCPFLGGKHEEAPGRLHVRGPRN